MNSTLKTFLIVAGVIAGIGVGGYLMLYIFVWYIFNIGCGFDDGPFEAVLIEPIEFTEHAEKFDLSNDAKLILENRNDTLSPIITLIENGKVKWTLDTDTRNTKGYEKTRIWNISNVKVSNGTDPIELRFTGHWTYGSEFGSMRIDRNDGDNSFCLSW